MKIKVFALALLLCALAGCGGPVQQAKISAPVPTASPTPFPTPTPVAGNVTLNAGDVMNMGMIGQT